MFTGLIQKIGRVKRVSRGKGLVLEFAFDPWPQPLVKGESVAVNGVCLTVVDCDRTRFTADVLGETETRTGLAELLPGARVNLERAMRAGDRFGGHGSNANSSTSPLPRDTRLTRPIFCINPVNIAISD